MPENTLIWTQNIWLTSYRQWLVWQITIDHYIDPLEGVELVKRPDSYSVFKLDINIKGKKEAMEKAKKDKLDLVLQTDESKLDQDQTAAMVCWEDKLAAKQKERSIFLRQNKKILDVELWAISEALEIAKKIANPKTILVTIFLDSQKALRAIALPCIFQKSWYLRSLVYKKTEELQQIGHLITFQCILGYFGIIRNEKADLSARNRAEKGRKLTEWWSSLAYIKRKMYKIRSKNFTKWHETETQDRKATH